MFVKIRVTYFIKNIKYLKSSYIASLWKFMLIQQHIYYNQNDTKISMALHKDDM